MVTPPILDNKRISSPSAFAPSALLREARRQGNLAAVEVPSVCILDPDGDLDPPQAGEAAQLPRCHNLVPISPTR